MFGRFNMEKITLVVSAAFLILVIAIISPSIIHFTGKSKEINVESVQKTVEKYVVECYAVEGSYPADLYYLQENYGLILDEDNYIYDYEVFASNVMPKISVIVKQ